MRKNIIVFAIFIVITLSGCGEKGPEMDQLSDENNYHYRNPNLGFSLVLPPDFIYYQTQRLEPEEGQYVDVEFFIPTSDQSYPQEVPSYAKPIVVRIFMIKDWDEFLEASEDGLEYIKIGEKGRRTYTLKFWIEPPADWEDKWSEEMRQGIVDSFKID